MTKEKCFTLQEFKQYIRHNRENILIVVSCSKSKRNNKCIQKILNNLLSWKELIKINLPTPIADLSKEYYNCIYRHKPQTIIEEKEYPAYIRYSGKFFQALTSTSESYIPSGQIWLHIIKENYKILILSALYGYIEPWSPIKNYELKIDCAPNKCKEKHFKPLLPKILQKTNTKEALFFTTNTYYKEAVKDNTPNTYLVQIWKQDNKGNKKETKRIPKLATLGKILKYIVTDITEDIKISEICLKTMPP